MRSIRFLPALLALAFCVAPAWAVDLNKIPRTIAREPAYRGTPTYCLLVFGLEAKTRVWLVLDADTLYVDRNGNGDLTQPDKRVQNNGFRFDVGRITETDGSTRETFLWLRRVSSGILMGLQRNGRVQRYVGFDATDRLTFADRPADAPIVHFDGPLTMKWFGQAPVLVPRQRCRFFTNLGTQGLGKGTFVSVACCSVPGGTKLSAVIEYPNQNAGEKPIVQEIDLGSN